MADLHDLVGLGLPTLWLQVQDFCDPLSCEDVVAPTNAFIKTETP
jgi:hypothetical protein